MTELNPILAKHNLNLTQFRFYEKQMPEQRKALHLAVRETLLLPNMNIAKFAKLLNVDRGKIYRMFYGNDANQLPQRWSEFEDEILTKNFKTMTYKALAAELNRTKDGVRQRVKTLGLRKAPWPRQHQTDQTHPSRATPAT